MKENLNISGEELDRFLATLYTSAEWGQAAEHLEEDEHFIYKGFMNQEIFNAIC